MKSSRDIALTDLEPGIEQMRDEVVDGLTQRRKTISSKYLYDLRGSQLFDRICELDEYYPTRTELGIMRDSIDEIAELTGPSCLLIEYGSGSSLKTRILLDRLEEVAGYVPVDISRAHLLASAKGVNADYPALEVLPVCADFTAQFEVPECDRPIGTRLLYFPGSTIGNLQPDKAVDLLRNAVETCGPDGGMLIGVDLKKDAAILERAYDDAAGVTAAFNKNVLVRLNRELGADFDVDQFQHEAIYNDEKGRIEMHLRSRRAQVVRVGGTEISFEAGETIHTEISHKYSISEFAALASAAGFTVDRVWTDAKSWFSVQYLSVD